MDANQSRLLLACAALALASASCSTGTDPSDASAATDVGSVVDTGSMRADQGVTDSGLAIRDSGAIDVVAVDIRPPPADVVGVDTGPMPTDAPADLGAPGTDGGSPSAMGCFTDVTAGHHVFTCDGIVYDVEISPACALGGCGLIFDVHGATMNAASEDRNTNLRALGSAAGYVVVQPTGPATGIGPQWDPARDDPKILAAVQLTMRAMRVDTHRVHITGFSQGGFMSWRMLCAHADLFASVAPAAACGNLFPHCAFNATERPSQEIPVLYIHGSRDNIVPGCSLAMRDAVVNGWSMTPAAAVSMDANYTWSRYTDATGNVFEFIDHSYSAYSYVLGGHCLPGSADIGSSRVGTSGYGCDHAAPVTWGAAVLAFFQAHPRH